MGARWVLLTLSLIAIYLRQSKSEHDIADSLKDLELRTKVTNVSLSNTRTIVVHPDQHRNDLTGE